MEPKISSATQKAATGIVHNDNVDDDDDDDDDVDDGDEAQ
jgi:hypothetical protein